jgi:hypothetical protein
MRLVVRDVFPRWYEWDIEGRELRMENYTSFVENKRYSVLYQEQCPATTK